MKILKLLVLPLIFSGITSCSLTSKPYYSFVNNKVNTSLTYKADTLDHWQTPLESRLLGTGDCEDYALMKYLLLRDTYLVHLVVGRTSNGQMHMVLRVVNGGGSYYLDNLHKDPVPASVYNMKVLYMFDELGVYDKNELMVQNKPPKRFIEYLSIYNKGE